ncbi:MAG: hypothetical protein IKP65_08805 [Alphaproteobacteria bacterium]|nr:hypothetical protein [Alphaproteobacteria bacterium]
MNNFCIAMIWILAIIGGLNLLFCLACGDFVSAIASLLATPVVCWIYSAFYAMVGCGFSRSFTHGFIIFLAVAIPFIASSLIYAFLTMKHGQANIYLAINMLILASLLIH